MTRAHETPPTMHALPAVRDAIPVLTSERLTLRAPVLEDLPTLSAINKSVADVTLRSGGEDGDWADFIQMSVTWVLRGHGWWTVTDETGPCGFVGIGFEPGDHEPELGYLLTPATRGKGYATEACAVARDWAWAGAQLPTLVSYISDHNTASQNVARKLGAARDAAAEAALGEDKVQVWRHPKPTGAP